jgi:hypothetical protein
MIKAVTKKKPCDQNDVRNGGYATGPHEQPASRRQTEQDDYCAANRNPPKPKRMLVVIARADPAEIPEAIAL